MIITDSFSFSTNHITVLIVPLRYAERTNPTRQVGNSIHNGMLFS